MISLQCLRVQKAKIKININDLFTGTFEHVFTLLKFQDEVGDFISGFILSPYPPQIRQAANIVPSETSAKKTKIERTRYNSNASSVDSEPPSPTPRITRPGFKNLYTFILLINSVSLQLYRHCKLFGRIIFNIPLQTLY